MNHSSFFRFLDAPLAIVVGTVGAVLVAIQLGVVGMLAQGQVDQAAARDASAKAHRGTIERCVAIENRTARTACLRTHDTLTGASGHTAPQASFAQAELFRSSVR